VLSASVTVKLADLASVLAAAAFVVVMAVVSGRLLGIRAGRFRSFLAALIGCLAGIAGAIEAAPHRSSAEQGLLAVLFGVLATMVVIVLMQALSSPSRGARRPSRRALLHPLRWLRHQVSPVTRTWQVLGHARQRGLARFEFVSSGGIASAEFGRRLRLTLEDCGGMFIKFGQIASTRTDLLAEPVTAELSKLRSSVRAIPADELRPLIEAELSEPIQEVFSSFEFEPLAAASIGQTHRGVLSTGEEVVAKIQRPGMEDLLARDATVLRLLASLTERRREGARSLGVRELVEEIISGMRRELDYHREATMSRRLARGSEEEALVNVPRVYDEVSTGRFLVMEEVVGKSVDDPLAVQTCGVPPERLARSLLRTFLRQVIQDGAYHADPHPGNVFVDDLGRLWLLDFGAVGLLDPVARQSLQEMALGMTLAEPQIVARAVRRLAGQDSPADLRALEADVGLLMVETGAGERFDPRIIGEVLATMTRHGLRPPRSMLQLSRALLTLDGTLRVISTDFDLPAEATALVREVTRVEADASDDVMKKEVLRALPVLRDLPEHVDELATQLRAGRLTVRTERFAGEDRRVLSSWLDRILLAGVGVGGALASALLLLAANLARSVAVADALRAIGFIGIVLSFTLLIRTVAQVFERRRHDSS
jgi:ubiquinone biosynthesis protein